MGGGSTVLTSVKEGDLWCVQIAWPSGTTRYFGKFGSEREALGWIDRHRWLTERDTDGAKIKRPWGSVSQRKSAVDVATGQAEADNNDRRRPGAVPANILFRKAIIERSSWDSGSIEGSCSLPR
jgi:hypothetical protein